MDSYIADHKQMFHSLPEFALDKTMSNVRPLGWMRMKMPHNHMALDLYVKVPPNVR